MPRISEFFGLTIYMYWFDTRKHRIPHFHVRYQGVEATFDLLGNVLEGRLSVRALKLIREWCVERQRELQAAWKAASEGKEIPWIQPLQ